jgi:CRISPR type III-A-associated RAMP protein Csm4
MPIYNSIKLKHFTPLHIGTGKENYDFSASELQSDTLSAALAALRVQQGKDSDTENFLKSFRLSSAFPFWKETYFLPKAQGKVNVKVTKKEEHEYRKQLKQLKYIDSKVWSILMNGEDVIIESSQLQGAFLLATNSDFEIPFKSQVNQRVSVPRIDNQNAEPFFFDWTFYHKDAGLYCLTDAQDAKFNEIVCLFKQLGETGLGTDRNIGGGKFDVETDKITLPDITDANHTVLLSLYIPAQEELPQLQLSEARYGLVLRGGYMAGSSEECFRHLRKRSVYMFNVGSIFPITTKLTGKTVNLAPDWNDERMHPVYRSGKPFYLLIKTDKS